MATNVREMLHLDAERSNLNFGPWDFRTTKTYTQFFGVEIQVAATTLAQLIAGSSPAFTAITTIEYLLIYPDQQISVGLHGVNAQTDGFTVNANQPLRIEGSINELSVYNGTSSTANIVLVIGGT